MKNRRVVITGIGVVSPIGIGCPDYWDSLRKGSCGCGRISRFDSSANKTQIACEVKNFEPPDYFDAKTAKRTSKFIQYALTSALMAQNDGDFKIADRDRTGVYIGTGAGGYDALDDTYSTFYRKGPRFLSPFAITNVIPNMAASNVAIALEINGPCVAPTAACASGLHAIYDACTAIRFGFIDAAFAGGSESTITSLAFAGYDALRVLSQRNDDFATASRPFDTERDGFVMAEGAAILLLEEFGSAMARGARIYGEIVSGEVSCDAAHITSPDTSGRTIARTMSNTIERAGARLEEIAYISAHGTSTYTNDLIEAKAICSLFEGKGGAIPVTAIKSMIGHTLGASGALAMAAGLMSLRENIIPPTINTKHVDPDIGPINLVTEPTEIDGEKKYMMTNSFGFGGHNACVMIKKA
jgi:3-oxoacyl-[acyl-carrier-protein] synthase II